MEDEEYSKAVFYTRIFAIVALIILLGFMFRPFVVDSYLWVMELKEGPATFFVGIIGFGGLILATAYNGYETRKNLKEEKQHQARNNAAILYAEIQLKVSSLSSIINAASSEENYRFAEHVIVSENDFRGLFSDFSCIKNSAYFIGLPPNIIINVGNLMSAFKALEDVKTEHIKETPINADHAVADFIEIAIALKEKAIKNLDLIQQKFSLK